MFNNSIKNILLDYCKSKNIPINKNIDINTFLLDVLLSGGIERNVVLINSTRFWDVYRIIKLFGDYLIQYEYAYATGDFTVEELGYTFDFNSVKLLSLPPDHEKYTLSEFFGAIESDSDFFVMDDEIRENGKQLLKNLLYRIENTKHAGDCTSESHSCPLCYLKLLLSEYEEYYFHNKIPE